MNSAAYLGFVVCLGLSSISSRQELSHRGFSAILKKLMELKEQIELAENKQEMKQ